MTATDIRAPISAGELLDKISILEIKLVRIADNNKRKNVQNELQKLSEIERLHITPTDVIDTLAALLRSVNALLWDAEDEVRALEKAGDFGPAFIRVARSIYHQNDRRFLYKSQINEAVGSLIREEKSHALATD